MTYLFVYLFDIQHMLVSIVQTKALYQLYNDPDSGNKRAADSWLQALQQSPEAWTLPWILLQHQVSGWGRGKGGVAGGLGVDANS